MPDPPISGAYKFQSPLYNGKPRIFFCIQRVFNCSKSAAFSSFFAFVINSFESIAEPCNSLIKVHLLVPEDILYGFVGLKIPSNQEKINNFNVLKFILKPNICIPDKANSY